MNISLSPFAPENLASRDGFGRPVPRQPILSPRGYTCITHHMYNTSLVTLVITIVSVRCGTMVYYGITMVYCGILWYYYGITMVYYGISSTMVLYPVIFGFSFGLMTVLLSPHSFFVTFEFK